MTFVPVVLLVAFATPAGAQFGKFKDKIKQRVEQGVDKATDKALDKGEQKVKCAWDDSACISKAKSEGKDVETTGGGAAQAGTPKGGAASAPAKRPGEGAWANYDFVPGERVMFAEDLSRDRVGNFPKRLELEKGTMEVVDWEGRRWLRNTTDAEFTVVLPEALPERWTMEFEIAIPWNAMWIYPGEKTDQGANYVQSIMIGGTAFDSYKEGGKEGSAMDWRKLFEPEEMYPENGWVSRPLKVRVHADGRYMKAYLEQFRVVNLPNMGKWTGNKIHFYFRDNTVNGKQMPGMVTNLSINAGGRELYDALMDGGRVTTQGIYFDTGSDRIRPESSGTLKEIADMLAEHADLNLTIEGHTDNVGDAAANQTLSEKRAAAVKAALTAQPYGIDPGRLQTKGLGATKPKSPNTTPEGRQNNRRVELVKM